MKKFIVIGIFMMSLVALDNLHASGYIWRSGLDLTNCFLQPNGDVHCYDKNTGRIIVLKKV